MSESDWELPVPTPEEIAAAEERGKLATPKPFLHYGCGGEIDWRSRTRGVCGRCNKVLRAGWTNPRKTRKQIMAEIDEKERRMNG